MNEIRMLEVKRYLVSLGKGQTVRLFRLSKPLCGVVTLAIKILYQPKNSALTG